MDIDKIMPVVVLAIVIYVWGCLNRGWTSPVDIAVGIACRAGGHRWCGHDQPWSDDGDTTEEDTDPPMSTPDAHHGPLKPPRRLTTPLTAPPDQLPNHPERHVKFDPSSQDRQPGETRIAWTRRQLDARLLTPGEIDSIGAAKFRVDPRTVRRWRAQVAGITLADLERSEKAQTDTGGADSTPTPGRRGQAGRQP